MLLLHLQKLLNDIVTLSKELLKNIDYDIIIIDFESRKTRRTYFL